MRNWAAGLVLALPCAGATTSPDIIWQFGGLTGVNSAVYSPNGQVIAAGGWDDTIKIYNAPDGRLLRTLTGHTYILAEVRFSPNGQTLASAGRDYRLKLWRVSDWQQILNIDHPWHLTSVAWSPDGTKVATACQDNYIRLFRASDGALLRTFLLPVFNYAEKVAFSPNGNIIAGAGGDSGQGRIVLWDPNTGNTIRTIIPNSNYLRDIAFSPDGSTLASANGYTNIAQLWSVSTGALVGQLTGHTGPVWSIQYSPDGTVLATGSGNGEQVTKLWSMPAGTLLRTLPMHPNWVQSTEFSPDSSILITGSSDVRKWRVSDGTLLGIMGANPENYPSIAYLPNSTSVATSISSANPRVALWSTGNGQFQRNLPGNRDSVAFSPGGQLYASTVSPPTVEVRNVSDGSVYRNLMGHTENVYSADFSADGQFAATSGGYYQDLKGMQIIRDCNARLWRLSDGMLLRTLTGHNRVVMSVAISPDVQ